MPFELAHATLDDIPEICKLRDDAFEGTSELFARCFPQTQAMMQFGVEGFKHDFNDPSWRMIKYVDTDKNAIAAFAVWFVPAKKPDGTAYTGGATPDEVLEIPWPSDCDKALNTEVFWNFAKARQAVMGTRLHYYLELLGTHPQYRGSGAARKLIEWGLKLADEEGLEAYVEALDQVIPLYEKFGWKAVSSYTNEKFQHTETFMLRPAKRS